jgi:hypothetical protein
MLAEWTGRAVRPGRAVRSGREAAGGLLWRRSFRLLWRLAAQLAGAVTALLGSDNPIMRFRA